MRKLCTLAILVLGLATLASVPARAGQATTYDNRCSDATNADDWGSAAVYCQQAYEAYLRDARHESTEALAYGDRDLGDIDLGAAGYANLHFDSSTGQDQLARAQSDLQAMLNDPHCPMKEKAYIRKTSLPLVMTWAQYTSSDGS